jgi:secreted trypsin-like serine protease
MMMVCSAIFALGTVGCQPPDAQDEVTSEIIGGVTDPGDPSVVALFAHKPGATTGALCTATVISPTVLLTAAHCVDPAVVGAGNVFDVYTGTTFGTTKLPQHVAATHYDPRFNVNNVTAGHDVGVVILASPTSLRPLPINTSSIVGDAGKAVRLVGYGMNSHVDVASPPPTNVSGLGIKRTATSVIDNVGPLLVHIGNSNQQTCHGDSGGPALMKFAGVEKIIGITSFGTDMNSVLVCYNGGEDTRVDVVASFIEQYL